MSKHRAAVSAPRLKFPFITSRVLLAFQEDADYNDFTDLAFKLPPNMASIGWRKGEELVNEISQIRRHARRFGRACATRRNYASHFTAQDRSLGVIS